MREKPTNPISLTCIFTGSMALAVVLINQASSVYTPRSRLVGLKVQFWLIKWMLVVKVSPGPPVKNSCGYGDWSGHPSASIEHRSSRAGMSN
jgi:hypothetical protein